MTLLERTAASLPSAWYYDAAQYARELEAVWYRDWVCVARQEDLREPGDYLVAAIGEESVIVTRDREGRPRAFHNTCRHRGSQLCEAAGGRFAGGRIVCPYHAWSYALSGELLATPKMDLPSDFRREDHALYGVPVDTWGGYLFVNLAEKPAAGLAEFLGEEAKHVQRWPLADLVSVHRETTALACNWKVFWENYSECYHCPGIHPELCRVMPLYREGLLSYADSRSLPQGAASDTRPRVGPGLTTWTLDGRSTLPLIEGPSAEDRKPGVSSASTRSAVSSSRRMAAPASSTSGASSHAAIGRACSCRRSMRSRNSTTG